MEYLALFSTTTAAMTFRRKLQKQDIPAEALPVPRKLSASCGIAIKFSCAEKPESLQEDGLEKIYLLSARDYLLIYDSE